MGGSNLAAKDRWVNTRLRMKRCGLSGRQCFTRQRRPQEPLSLPPPPPLHVQLRARFCGCPGLGWLLPEDRRELLRRGCETMALFCSPNSGRPRDTRGPRMSVIPWQRLHRPLAVSSPSGRIFITIIIPGENVSHAVGDSRSFPGGCHVLLSPVSTEPTVRIKR